MIALPDFWKSSSCGVAWNKETKLGTKRINVTNSSTKNRQTDLEGTNADLISHSSRERTYHFREHVRNIQLRGVPRFGSLLRRRAGALGWFWMIRWRYYYEIRQCVSELLYWLDRWVGLDCNGFNEATENGVLWMAPSRSWLQYSTALYSQYSIRTVWSNRSIIVVVVNSAKVSVSIESGESQIHPSVDRVFLPPREVLYDARE